LEIAPSSYTKLVVTPPTVFETRSPAPSYLYVADVPAAAYDVRRLFWSYPKVAEFDDRAVRSPSAS
jgi:hypothetical protein